MRRIKSFTCALTMSLLGSAAMGGCDVKENDDSNEPAPITVDCSFFAANGEKQHPSLSSVFGQSDGVSSEFSIGELKVSLHLVDPPYESRSFTVTVSTREGQGLTSTLYQIDRTKLPANDFLGGHGFTGLNHVIDPLSKHGLQFFCSARSSSDPA